MDADAGETALGDDEDATAVESVPTDDAHSVSVGKTNKGDGLPGEDPESGDTVGQPVDDSDLDLFVQIGSDHRILLDADWETDIVYKKYVCDIVKTLNQCHIDNPQYTSAMWMDSTSQLQRVDDTFESATDVEMAPPKTLVGTTASRSAAPPSAAGSLIVLSSDVRDNMSTHLQVIYHLIFWCLM